VGAPLALFVLKRFGRRGGLLMVTGCGVLFVRDLTMIVKGTPARLRRLPQFLLFFEAAVSGLAILAGLRAWVRRPSFAGEVRRAIGGGAIVARSAWAGRIATAAAATTFVLHAAHQAIYLRPGHGRR
jgi:hypothetical protein